MVTLSDQRMIVSRRAAHELSIIDLDRSLPDTMSNRGRNDIGMSPLFSSQSRHWFYGGRHSCRKYACCCSCHKQEENAAQRQNRIGIPIEDRTHKTWQERSAYIQQLQAAVAATPGVTASAISTNSTPSRTDGISGSRFMDIQLWNSRPPCSTS